MQKQRSHSKRILSRLNPFASVSVGRRLSRRKTFWISTNLFIAGNLLAWYSGILWPGFLGVMGLTFGVRHYCAGRLYKATLTSSIFIGLFLLLWADIKMHVTIPIVFTIGAITLLFQELYSYRSPPIDPAEELKQEIEDEEES